MKTRQDDFSTGSHPEENNLALSIVFKGSDGGYYKCEMDMSPASFQKVIVGNATRKPSWQKYVKHNTDDEKKAHNGRAGHYEPAKNVTGMILGLIEETAPAIPQ